MSNDALFLPPSYRRQSPLRYADTIAENQEWQYLVYEYARFLQRRYRLRSVLDVGCGAAYKTATFFDDPNLEVHAVDWDTRAASATFPRVHFSSHNLEERLELGRQFDLIVSSDVIEHMTHPGQLLDSIKRHAAPDALVVISTPERHAQQNGQDGGPSDNPAHAQEWDYYEFGLFIQRSGLRILEHFCVRPLGTFDRERAVFRALQRLHLGTARRYFRTFMSGGKGAGGCQVVVCELQSRMRGGPQRPMARGLLNG